MGTSLSWIAVKTTSSDTVNSVLKLKLTGDTEDIPESPCTSIQLPGGYYLVVFIRRELSARFLRKMSLSLPLLFGYVEEHVMYSTVAAWEAGRPLWSIVHNAQKGILDLEVKGTPPELFDAIRDSALREQTAAGVIDAEVDHIFDIPVQLAFELIGYRYDQEVAGIQNSFAVLEKSHRSWLKQIIGRRAP